MKDTLVYIVLIGLVLFLACGKYKLFKTPGQVKISHGIVTPQILSEKKLLGDQIYLPIGTKCFFTDTDRHEVVFKLPKGYAFLLRNSETGASKISIEGGGHSCTCTGGGSCTTFYNDDISYGCLQNTCTGSCVGKKTKSKSLEHIEGILSLDNTRIDKKIISENASLSDIGKATFFSLKEVQEELKRTYDLVYKHIPKPIFRDLNFETEKKYVFAKTYLYGFEIGLILPNDPELKKWMPGLKVMSLSEASKLCKCSGISGTVCKLKKAGLFGYEAYYCSGCTTCEMN